MPPLSSSPPLLSLLPHFLPLYISLVPLFLSLSLSFSLPPSLSLSDYFRVSVRLGRTPDGGMGSLQRLSSIADTDSSPCASATSASATAAAAGATPRRR